LANATKSFGLFLVSANNELRDGTILGVSGSARMETLSTAGFSSITELSAGAELCSSLGFTLFFFLAPTQDWCFLIACSLSNDIASSNITPHEVFGSCLICNPTRIC